MNIQQLQYVLAVDTCRHFVTASEKCYVTQATLSMMIRKLEDELGVKIFDRSKHPVIPTDIGQKIINQAKIVLQEASRIKELVKEETRAISGELRVGIIPTLAPYLLPLFLQSFMKKYPDVKLQISELTTDDIVKKLFQNQLDAGLLAIPLGNASIIEQSLFFEEFVVYASKQDKILNKKYVLPKDIDINRLCLLEEGHCLRNQVINLCELKLREKTLHQLDFSAASIETVKKIVELNEGITVLPSLVIKDLSTKQKNNIRYFKSPAPGREIGLVSFRFFVKEKLLLAFKNEILNNLPPELTHTEGK